MNNPKLPLKKIKSIIHLHVVNGLGNSQISKTLTISRSTVYEYIRQYNNSNLVYTDIMQLKNRDFLNALLQNNRNTSKSANYETLNGKLRFIHERLGKENINLKLLWNEYKQEHPEGYQYSQFVAHYNEWLKENRLKKAQHNRWTLKSIPEEDIKILKKWRQSCNKSKWERAVALFALNNGEHITAISKKVERSCKIIRKWHNIYITKGLEHLDLNRTRRIDIKTTDKINLKKERLIKIMHESPSFYNINRTSWSLQTLAQAYEKSYRESISKSMISEYVKSEGYSFKKARKVLTSTDPDYRSKLAIIMNILSNLSKKEKFFSVDEFGPFSIRIRGGRALAHKDETRTIPQRQKSKGSLICTAALELSTNQITHFYSNSKNTDEMIKLLEILLEKYAAEERIFFSWDAASWHASKKLYKKVEEVNHSEYRERHGSPVVMLAPLPSGAQFLNVIESIFSGMARAIIHNSDYESADECKDAIDKYFFERNKAFMNNPKQAGKKIWGKERIEPIFKESNNCKDPRWR